MDARGESDSVREARLKVRLDIMASHDRGAIMKTAPVGRAAFAIDSVSAMESKWENPSIWTPWLHRNSDYRYTWRAEMNVDTWQERLNNRLSSISPVTVRN